MLVHNAENYGEFPTSRDELDVRLKEKGFEYKGQTKGGTLNIEILLVRRFGYVPMEKLLGIYKNRFLTLDQMTNNFTKLDICGMEIQFLMVDIMWVNL